MRPKKKRSSLKFGEKIRKNTENSEKYFGKFGKILWKIRKNTPENSEKYFGKFGKILPKIRIPDAKSLFPTMPPQLGFPDKISDYQLLQI